MQFFFGFVVGGFAAGVGAYYYGKKVGVEVSTAFARAQQIGANVTQAGKDLTKGL